MTAEPLEQSPAEEIESVAAPETANQGQLFYEMDLRIDRLDLLIRNLELRAPKGFTTKESRTFSKAEWLAVVFGVLTAIGVVAVTYILFKQGR
jgi:hypothetical protein